MIGLDSLLESRRIVLTLMVVMLAIGAWSVLQLWQMAEAMDLPAPSAPTGVAAGSPVPRPVYVVQPGDWPVRIAEELCGDHVLAAKLRHEDGSKVTALIHPGDRLVLPAECVGAGAVEPGIDAIAGEGAVGATPSAESPAPGSIWSVAGRVVDAAGKGPLAVPAALALLITLGLLLRKVWPSAGALIEQSAARRRNARPVIPARADDALRDRGEFRHGRDQSTATWADPGPDGREDRAMWTHATQPDWDEYPPSHVRDGDRLAGGEPLRRHGPHVLDRPPAASMQEASLSGSSRYLDPSPPAPLERTERGGWPHAGPDGNEDATAAVPVPTEVDSGRGEMIESRPHPQDTYDATHASADEAPTLREAQQPATGAHEQIADYTRDPLLGDPVFDQLGSPREGQSAS